MSKIADIYPLSHTQHGILYHTVYESDNDLYHNQLSFVVNGNPDLQIFEQAWQEVILRYEVLRTSFHWENMEKPMQVVHHHAAPEWKYDDWSSLNSKQQEAALINYLQTDKQNRFPLDKPCLMRIATFRISAESLQVVWSFHHLILDGWCLPLLLTEVLENYHAIATDSTINHSVVIPYKQYILWLQKQDTTTAKAYWTNELKDITSPTTVRQYGVSTTKTQSGYLEEALILDDQISTDLRLFVQESNITLNTFFQGVWAILLSRYTGEKNVVMGITTSGRLGSISSAEKAVGLFINTVPIVLNIIDDEPAVKWLQASQLKHFEREKQSFISLTEIHDVSALPRTQPLFESLFVFENYPVATLRASNKSGITLSGFKSYEQTNYPLTLVILPGKQISVQLSYNSEKFSASWIKQMLEHYKQLLVNISVRPLQLLSKINLITHQERALLDKWNDTAKALPADKTFLHIWEENTISYGGRVALIHNNHKVTYHELNVMSNRIAAYLLSRCKLKKNTGVILLLPRSIEFAACVLAVWKCGGYYIPVDCDYPPLRINTIIEDADAGIIIMNDGPLSVTLSEQHQDRRSIVKLDVEALIIAEMPEEKPDTDLAPEDLAYVIYTSGSTGKPKGAMIEHLGMLNHLFAKVNSLSLNADSIVVQNASQCFDISVWQFFSALATGGHTLIYTQEMVSAPEEFIRGLHNDGVTIVEVVPSYLELLLSTLDKVKIPSLFKKLQFLLVTGEAVSKPSVEGWISCFPGIPIVNAYGPTEASDDITHHFMTQVPQEPEVPIGKAIQNVSIYILDDHLNICPPGVKGEICVSGISVGRGYLNNDGQTSKVFLQDPFAHGKQRMYKTGDIGMYLPDGVILYSGRKDQQVKVRGYRIELGEIEAALSQLPGILGAVVKDFRNSRGELFICAFLKGVHKSDTIKLKQLLAKELPEYMIPGHFIWLEELPLNANGKTDRDKLTIPETLLDVTLSNSVEMEISPIEAIIITIWKGVLQRSHIHPRDNFFELGGHSLKAMQAISMLKDAFAVELPIRTMFDHPTPTELAVHLSGQRTGRVTTKAIPSQKGDLFALSYSQERLWYIQQTNPLSPVYNMSGIVNFQGELQVKHLEDSIADIIKRHAIFRTTFEVESGIPKQRIHPFTGFKLPVTIINESEIPSEIFQHAASLPFDLENGQIFRPELFYLGKDKHVLFLGMHHIAGDGWSISILLQEIAASYNCRVQNKQQQDKQLPLQFYDYAMWQRANLEAGIYNDQLNYWNKKLIGVPDYLDLPLDKPRPEAPTFHGAVHAFEINDALYSQINAFNRDNNLSVYITLLSCFAGLLYRYTGQKDFVIGSPVVNRPVKELEKLIGFFVNTLALRITPKGDLTFKELCKQVRSTFLDAFDNQEIPFEQVIDGLDVNRQINVNTLFQVMFVMQHANGMPHFEGVEAAGFETGVNTSKFDITLIVKQTDSSLEAEIEYNTDIFYADKVERLAQHFIILLTDMLSKPDKPIGQHDMLSAAESHCILNVWNGGTTHIAPKELITDLFHLQVQRAPHQIAISSGDVDLTYGQLDRLTNQLANKLRDCGVQAGNVVGLAMERGIASVSGMIAILKTGGIYLPLDITYPAQRLKYMTEDSGVKVIVTTAAFKGVATELTNQIIDFDEIGSESPLFDLSPAITAADGAYVNYTSGSTGLPKGVLIPHCAVIRLVKDTNYISLQQGQNVSHNSSISFDASTLEVWLPLLNGGTLVLLDKHSLLDLQNFGAMLKRKQIDVMFLTTSLFNQIANSYPESFGSLSYLVVGGEKALINTFDNVMTSTYPPQNLVNGYGPTENTTFSICYNYINAALAGQRVPLGRPITNSTAYLLDENCKPVPAGVTGEIYLGGAGLAIGYINNAKLSTEKFVDVYLDDFREERLYRTNDRGRYRQNGEIDYYGRNDRQIKLGGFRIELGEIESALLQLPGIKDCYVLLENEETIFSFYTVNEDASISQMGIKLALKNMLPSFMIPSVVIEIDELPINTNGKIDIEKLKKLLITPEEPTINLLLSSTEHQLFLIWKRLLKVDKINLNDNFFDLGGHSLLITRMLAEAAKVFNTRLSIQTGFENPTIESLAAIIDGKDFDTELQNIPGIVRYVNSSIYPLSFAQERLWFINEYNGNSSSYNIYAALKLTGILDINALDYAFTQIVERHAVLRTIFKVEDHRPSQIIKPPQPVKIIPIVIPEDQLPLLMQLLHREIGYEFDLRKGPLWYVKLYRLSESEHVLLFNMHHIITDGWSVSVLVDELVLFYNSERKNEKQMLPELPFHYADFSKWQRRQFDEGLFNYQLKYWLNNLAGTPDIDYLKLDHSRQTNATASGKIIPIGSFFSKDIHRQAVSLNTTPFVYLMASFQLYLYFISGEKDVVTGTNIANRNWEHTDALIGCFVNQLVIRTVFNDDELFSSVLNKVHQTSLRAFNNQDVPFEVIVKELRIPRQESKNPIFQTKLVLQNGPVNKLDLEGLRVENILLDNGTSKFDFMILLEESGDTISGNIEFNDTLFEAHTIKTMLGQWQLLVNNLYQNEKRCLADIRVAFINGCEILAQKENELLNENRQNKLRSVKRKEITNNIG